MPVVSSKDGRDRSIWISGKYNPVIKIASSMAMWPLRRKTEYVIAWKCSKCNKIELMASE
jgi:hypothetical protein